jgi:hypothetical protein
MHAKSWIHFLEYGNHTWVPACGSHEGIEIGQSIGILERRIGISVDKKPLLQTWEQVASRELRASS